MCAVVVTCKDSGRVFYEDTPIMNDAVLHNDYV